MSAERPVQTPSGVVIPLTKHEPTEEEKRKYRETAIATRSITSQFLNVALPPDVHGEWIVNTPQAIQEAEAKGFSIDTEYAGKSSLHGDGSGKGIVGDVIHVTIPKWQKEILDELYQEEMKSRHGEPTATAGDLVGRYVNTPPVTPGILNVNESKQSRQEVTPTKGK